MKCEICDGLATDRHHKFAKHQWRKDLYPEFIHDERNLQYLCNTCHINKKQGIVIWNEQEFCEAMGIEKRGKKCGL